MPQWNWAEKINWVWNYSITFVGSFFSLLLLFIVFHNFSVSLHFRYSVFLSLSLARTRVVYLSLSSALQSVSISYLYSELLWTIFTSRFNFVFMCIFHWSIVNNQDRNTNYCDITRKTRFSWATTNKINRHCIHSKKNENNKFMDVKGPIINIIQIGNTTSNFISQASNWNPLRIKVFLVILSLYLYICFLYHSILLLRITFDEISLLLLPTTV